MSSPDHAVLQFMAAHSHTSWTLDTVMVTAADNDFIKGLVLVLFWLAWSARGHDQERRRTILLSTLPAPFVAFFAGRLLAHVLPFRLRPIANPAMHWPAAEGLSWGNVHRTWSSLPSDHAACYAAIASSLLFVSRPIGLWALAYVALVVDLPRVYLGLHYPSDILAGSLVGLAVAALLAAEPVRGFVAAPMLRLQRVRPGAFYGVIFLCLYTVGCINSVHVVVDLSLESVKAWSHHPVTRALSSGHVLAGKAAL